MTSRADNPTNVHMMLTGVVAILLLRTVNTDDSNCRLAFPEMTSSSDEAIANLTDSQLHCDVYNHMISLMAELDILTVQKRSCYAIKWISRQVASKANSHHSRPITITLQIEEHFDSNIGKDSDLGSVMSSRRKSRDTITRTICHSSGLRPGPIGQQSLSMVHVNNSGENGGNSNSSGILVTTKSNGDKKEGLSHTQVVVIATCSAVIGTFFIVAAVLRIRNYIKRWRETQETEQERYSPSLSQPAPGSRKDKPEAPTAESNAVKLSRQSSSTVIGGNRYYPVNSHGTPESPTLSPKHCFLDSNPVLVVTAPSPILSSPTDSHASIQFIDEEAENDNQFVPKEPEIAEAELSPVKAVSPVSVNSISSENEVCNEDMADASITEPPKCEEEKLLGNRSDSIAENAMLPSENVSNGMMSFDLSPTEMSSPSDVEMASPELLFVTAGLTQSDESLSCSHNASYSYGNQVEYSNSLFNMEDDLGYYDNDVAMDTTTTTPDEDLKQNGCPGTPEAEDMGNSVPCAVISDDPSSSLSSPASSPTSDNTMQTNKSQIDRDMCGNLIGVTSFLDNRDIIRPNSLPGNNITSAITDNSNGSIEPCVNSQINSTGNGSIIPTDNNPLGT